MNYYVHYILHYIKPVHDSLKILLFEEAMVLKTRLNQTNQSSSTHIHNQQRIGKDDSPKQEPPLYLI